MKKWTTPIIRQKWLDFFASHDHLIIPSASLIPKNDNSLLWINSGVAALKDYFAGFKNPPAPRLTNSQKSIRTNDIERVGLTSRHHTFFEMLGNFSIGDYFKVKALELAFELLIKVFEIPLEKLYITYYDQDLETYEIWKKLGIFEDHLLAGTKKTNFWDLGLGPCGPCTEIFVDRGAQYHHLGPEMIIKDIENDRFVEIYNIVFSTLNNDGKGNYTELKTKNVDTGAGLERLSAILQNVPTNYDTDIFQALLAQIASLSPYSYKSENYFLKDPQQRQINTKFKIIADHMRSAIYAIFDGAKPSNIGRGYIIRRLIRRSYRHAIGLKITGETFLYRLVASVLGPDKKTEELIKIEKIIKNEESLFALTISQGKKILEKEIQKSGTIDFAFAFKMFETYGYPIELTQEILAEQGINLDISKFEDYKALHAQKSTKAKVFGMKKVINSLASLRHKIDHFVGYEKLQTKAKIIFLANHKETLKRAKGHLFIILDESPFYATSGGQKHDQGYFLINQQKLFLKNVFKDKWGNHIHELETEQELYLGQTLEAIVDSQNRRLLEINHSATHLLFSALRELYGQEIKQLGSNNNENRLTIDYPANRKINAQEIEAIEKQMQTYIKNNVEREYIITTIDQAKALGAIITIEETEYMDPQAVRLVKFAKITSDLCGGTHTSKTSNLETFKIVAVESKGTGIYRIVAITTFAKVSQYYQKLITQAKTLVSNLETKIKKIAPQSLAQAKAPWENNNDQATYQLWNQYHLKLQALYKQALKSQKQWDLKTLDFQKVTFGKQEVLLVNAQKDDNIALLSAQLREKYPQTLVITLAEGKDQKRIIITSKVINSLAFWKKIAKAYELRGGGNQLLVQGLAPSHLAFSDLKRIFND